MRQQPSYNPELTPELCYIIGLAQSDGHLKELSRNRGNFSIELSKRDEDIIYKIQKFVPYKSTISYRKRDTNFKKNSETIQLRVHRYPFRMWLIENGVPPGKKSEILKPPPIIPYWVDYLRGYYDGDGSLGITGLNKPFISLVTKSEYIKEYVCKKITESECGNLNLSRNKRDNVYNICIFNKNAIKFASLLYYPNCICLDRKYKKFQDMINLNKCINLAEGCGNEPQTNS